LSFAQQLEAIASFGEKTEISKVAPDRPAQKRGIHYDYEDIVGFGPADEFPICEDIINFSQEVPTIHPGPSSPGAFLYQDVYLSLQSEEEKKTTHIPSPRSDPRESFFSGNFDRKEEFTQEETKLSETPTIAVVDALPSPSGSPSAPISPGSSSGSPTRVTREWPPKRGTGEKPKPDLTRSAPARKSEKSGKSEKSEKSEKSTSDTGNRASSPRPQPPSAPTRPSLPPGGFSSPTNRALSPRAEKLAQLKPVSLPHLFKIFLSLYSF
jgi:hypothetical protein